MSTVLITGASRGIGRATALMFAKEPERIANETQLFEKLIQEGYIAEEDLPFFSQYYGN